MLYNNIQTYSILLLMFLYLLPTHIELSQLAKLDIERLKPALLQTFSPEHVASVSAGNNFVF